MSEIQKREKARRWISKRQIKNNGKDLSIQNFKCYDKKLFVETEN